MRHIKYLKNFERLTIPLIKESSDEWDDSEDGELRYSLTAPKTIYSESELLFNEFTYLGGVEFALLKGKPPVGSGIWILKCPFEAIPTQYLYSKDADDPDFLDLIHENTFDTWATNIWKNQKNLLGEGVLDYQKPDDEKTLVKMDKELKTLVIDELEIGLSRNYMTFPEDQFPFNREVRNFRQTSTDNNYHSRIRHAIFKLEKTTI